MVFKVCSLFRFLLPSPQDVTPKLSPGDPAQNQTEMTNPYICEEKAREVAHRDAKEAYQDLSIYTIDAKLDGGVWLIEYIYEGRGGGPSYKISAESGEIKEKVYYQ